MNAEVPTTPCKAEITYAITERNPLRIRAFINCNDCRNYGSMQGEGKTGPAEFIADRRLKKCKQLPFTATS